MTGKVYVKAVVVLLIAAVLTACTAARTAVRYRNLETEVRMSDSIFLDPSGPGDRTVYMDIRNTSGKELDVLRTVQSPVALLLSERGYALTSNPDIAHYILQANVLYIDKTNPEAARSMLANGYGGAILGGAIGAAIGARSSGPSGVIGGAIGAIVGDMVNSATEELVKGVTYTAVVDVQISERARGPVKQVLNASLSQGSSTTIRQTEEIETNFRRYRTRIVASSTKVNLSFEEARPKLADVIARSIAGVF